DHLRTPIHLTRCRQNLGADVAIVLVGVAAFFPCACFHEHLVPVAHEFGTSRRNQTYAALARLEFARNTDSHVMLLGRFAGPGDSLTIDRACCTHRSGQWMQTAERRL